MALLQTISHDTQSSISDKVWLVQVKQTLFCHIQALLESLHLTQIVIDARAVGDKTDGL